MINFFMLVCLPVFAVSAFLFAFFELRDACGGFMVLACSGDEDKEMMS